MQEAPRPSDPTPPSNEERAHEIRPEPPVTPPPAIELPASEPLRTEPITASPLPASSATPPATPTPDYSTPQPNVAASSAPPPPPPPPRPIEVETSPVSKSDVRGPVIDIQAHRPTPPPEPPPRAQAVPPPSMSGTAAPAGAAPGQPAAPPPPPPPSSPQSAGPSAQPPPPAQPSMLRRTFWAVTSHLMLVLVIPTLFLGASITFLIWQLAGRKDSLVEDQGREALNFQINVAAVTALLGLSCVGLPLVCIAWFVAIVMSIVAAIHAGRGERYRYPWCLRIVTH